VALPLYLRAAAGVLTRRTGDTLPEAPIVQRGVTVDRGHLAAYDRVCGFRLSDELPPTYPHVLAFPLAMRLMAGADFPFPIVGIVHVANRITVAGPLSAESTLDFEVHAENLRPHERGRQVDVVAVATVDGREVWRGVSTYLRREKERTDSKERTAADPPAASALWRVPPSVGTEYAAVSGDRNPIHTSRVGARLFGFPRPIAHGMWSKARCLAALEGRLPDAYTVDIAFKLPLPLPSTVAFTASPAWTFALHDARTGKPHLAGSIG
jgi:hypothetical protein